MRLVPAILTAVLLAPVALADDPPAADVKTAITKALQRIEAGVTHYPEHRQCYSCHHQAMAVFSMTTAQRYGFTVNTELLKDVTDFSLRSFRNKSLISRGQGVGGDSTSVVYALHTFAAVERPYDDTMAALVEYLLVRQSRDGSWSAPAERPPTMGSRFTNTGLALFALQHYTPPADAANAETLRKRIDAAFNKARDWLKNNKPSATEDKVFHLKGLVYGNVEAREIEAARDKLIAEQLANGSWAQLPRMTGDAYATATSLVALREAGLDVSHEAYRKGIKYLLDTQKEDGAWVVQTRSRPLQIYFDNGDAGGRSQFISFAATGWAVLALLETQPRVALYREAP